MRKWGKMWAKRAFAVALALVLVLAQEAPVVASELAEQSVLAIEEASEEAITNETSTEAGDATVSDSEDAASEEVLMTDGALQESSENLPDGEGGIAANEDAAIEGDSEQEIDGEELAELFPGVSLEGFCEDPLIQEDKEELRETLEGFEACVQGEAYSENEIFVYAQDYETAELYAEAYGGTLVDWLFDYAFIRLNADPEAPVCTARDAVLASAEEDTALPAAWPNYYGGIASESEELCADETVESIESEYDANEGAELQENGIANINNDPYLSMGSANSYYQYQHDKMQTEVTWDAGYTGYGVKVAVLDTGVKLGHEDLGNVNSSRVAYYDYTNSKTVTGSISDTNGHGTHCTGIVGATRNNGVGGAGIAPGATLYDYNIFKESGFSVIAFQRGMQWAIEQGVDVISLSLYMLVPYDGNNPVVESSITTAYNNGIAVVAASGNFGGNTTNYPARCKNAISVGAVDEYSAKADFCNTDRNVRYSAPGVNIYSTYKDNNSSYTYMSGTSQATPCVAGAYAVVLQYARQKGLVLTKNARNVDLVLALMDKGCDKTGVGKGIPNLAKICGLKTKLQAPNTPWLLSGSILPGTHDRDTGVITICGDENTTLWYNTDGKKISVKNGVVYNATKADGNNTALVIYGGSTTVQAISIRNENKLCSKVAVFKYKLRPNVTSVTMATQGDVFTVQKGGKITLSANVLPATVANKNVTWSIKTAPAPVGVAISQKGVLSVTAAATVSSVVVRATSVANPAKYVDQTISITTNSNPVASIKASARSVTVYKYRSVELTMTTTLKDKTIASTYSKTKCVSSDDGIATVSLSGDTLTISGESAGKCTVYITATDGSGVKAAIPVVVNQPVENIAASAPSDRVVQGKGVTLSVKVTPVNVTNKKVKFKINCPGGRKPEDCGVSIDAKGNFKASKTAYIGKYQIVVSSTDESPINHVVFIRVVSATEGVSALTLSSSRTRIFRVTNGFGAPTTAKIYATTTGGRSDSNDYLSVTSSNPDIATVSKDSTGVYTVSATGNATGTVVITALTTDGTNIKKSLKLTVANPATGLTLGLPAGRSQVLGYGRKVQLLPTFITGSGAIDKTAKQLRWSSSSSFKAPVSQSGVVTGNCAYWTNQADSQVVITATTTDGSGVKASYTILLNPEIAGIYSYFNSSAHTITVYPYLSSRSTGSNYYYSFTYSASGNAEPSISRSGNVYSVVFFRKGIFNMTITTNDGSGKKCKQKIYVY